MKMFLCAGTKQSTSPSAQVSLMSGSLCTCWKAISPGCSPSQATGTEPEGMAVSTVGVGFPPCISVEVWDVIHVQQLVAAWTWSLLGEQMSCKASKGAVLALGGDLQVFSRAAFAAHCQFLCTVWWMRANPCEGSCGAPSSCSRQHAAASRTEAAGLAWPDPAPTVSLSYALE